MSLERALALVDSIKEQSVLFIGDTIVDEYVYVASLGKSPKEAIIPVRFKERERFDGGVDAAAKHVRSFCKEVVIGSSGPAVRKVRFVDPNYMRKLFEIHYSEGMGGREWPHVNEFDCVVVTDFGHGEIRPGADFSKASFLAASAQTNSSNIGFNLVTKFSKADYIVIDEPEARLAAQDRDSPIGEVLVKLAKGRAKKFIITHGKHGAYGYEEGRGVFFRPCFPDRPIDTMGAGDAFFAVTAPMARHGYIEDLLLIGHAAGTLKTQIIGHRKSVEKQELIEFLRAHG